MKLVESNYNEVKRTEFEKIMNGSGIDTSIIPENINFKNLLILETNGKFYECIFDIVTYINPHQSTITTKREISDRVNSINELKKLIIMQLAYGNYEL